MSAAVGRRLYAVLAACSAGVHLALLGHAGSVVTAAVLAVMIAGCLWCAVDLWRQGTLGAWLVVALMSLAMLAVHAPMPGHRHLAGGAVVAPAVPSLMALAMVLAVVEVVVAAAVLYARTRHRAAVLSDTPGR